jgi:hypothetical protein
MLFFNFYFFNIFFYDLDDAAAPPAIAPIIPPAKAPTPSPIAPPKRNPALPIDIAPARSFKNLIIPSGTGGGVGGVPLTVSDQYDALK